ncbi:glycosyltransferase family 4 protein [Allosalinactinospora lopnorensis]|uniref:glycosyltransferase family 4 protein n=1 Tax=Allosalinactinospora lopnorensis TaxID=1352348 RepID=UPI000623FA1D|nr:glycosyltransferase family 4 protein [Allosalinactinospora lopnorensis]
MRISLVGPAHPYKGGGARHTTELAHRLTARGDDVGIESWRSQYPSLLYPGRQTVDADEAEGPTYPRTRCRLAWYQPAGWWRTGRRIGRGSDLVVLTVFTPVQVPPYLGILGGIGYRARTVALCHNVLPHERGPVDVALMRALLRRVDVVLTHSPEQQRLANGLIDGAAAESRMAELPPHLPETTAPRLPDPGAVHGHLLFLGFVRPYKGVDVLLRALAEGAPPEVTLTVAGEFWGGSAELRALAADLGIADRVEFREGYIPAKEMSGLFARADALVLPYRSATATQNVWLAHEHGRPVIATRAGTLPGHVTEGVDGLLCDPGDAADLARVIKDFYSPGEALRLRAGVRPVAPEPYWASYLETLTG